MTVFPKWSDVGRLEETSVRQDAIDWMRKSGRRSVSLIGTAELPDGSSTRVLLSDLS